MCSVVPAESEKNFESRCVDSSQGRCNGRERRVSWEANQSTVGKPRKGLRES